MVRNLIAADERAEPQDRNLWGTEQAFFDKLHAVFQFDLDAPRPHSMQNFRSTLAETPARSLTEDGSMPLRFGGASTENVFG
jgi:hypothetical protein